MFWRDRKGPGVLHLSKERFEAPRCRMLLCVMLIKSATELSSIDRCALQPGGSSEAYPEIVGIVDRDDCLEVQ